MQIGLSKILHTNKVECFTAHERCVDKLLGKRFYSTGLAVVKRFSFILFLQSYFDAGPSVHLCVSPCLCVHLGVCVCESPFRGKLDFIGSQTAFMLASLAFAHCLTNTIVVVYTYLHTYHRHTYTLSLTRE